MTTKKFLLLFLLVLTGCASAPPSNHNDICTIFLEKPGWYKSAVKSAAKWGGPLHVPMAIMYQESSFKRDAKPEMQYFLGVVPTGRKSDAYGYSQALKSTWKRYKRETGANYKQRDNFAAAYDFIQWYMHTTYKANGVSKWDTYAQYLNYHEGQGGYARGSYRNKQWLMNTARRVSDRATRYGKQMQTCKAELEKKNRGWF
ncbi:MAG: transglycosylase SLT domain-containing protein [Pseudomonadota bacterium]